MYGIMVGIMVGVCDGANEGANEGDEICKGRLLGEGILGEITRGRVY